MVTKTLQGIIGRIYRSLGQFIIYSVPDVRHSNSCSDYFRIGGGKKEKVCDLDIREVKRV